MAEKTVRATADSLIRRKAMTVILIFTLLTLFSITMAIYDISTGAILYGALFGVAALIFVVLILLKINSVFGTYIAVKNDKLYIKSWVNDFLPYEADGGFLSDLKPSKTKLTEIPVEDITNVFVGTKDFIKRNATIAGKKLARTLYPYEHSSKKSRKRLISAIDLFYVETVDDECSFMCVHGYNAKAVVDVIGTLYRLNPDIYVKVNSREYKKYIRELQTETN